MDDAIVGKLRELLRGGITTEAQLVYLLVEIRKLYERREAKLPPYLELICDWTVHPKLTNKRWAKYYFTMVSGIHDPVLEFEQELAAVLGAEDLPQPDWTTALRLLVAVLKDCPLKFAGLPVSLEIAPSPGDSSGWVLKFKPGF